jgi:hypothetical protein
MTRKRPDARIGGGIASAVLIAGLAQVSHAQPEAATQPYSIETFGVFRELMLRGDFSPKIAMGSVMARRPSTGVGAISGARGEITIAEGKLIISYGKSDAPPAAMAETAALLATAKVKEWQTVRVESDVAPAAVDAFLAQAARTHGLDPANTFPFELRGTFTPYAMHVNVGPTGGPHGMGLPMAVTVERKGDEIEGGVAGLYVSQSLVGIVTHGGEHVHAHWVAPDGQSTAHLDLWGIKAGTTLLLPKPE